MISDSPYVSAGCWKDSLPRAITSIEGRHPALDGHYKSRQNAVQKCYQAAVHLGYSVFAVQDGGQCFSSIGAGHRLAKYGASVKCLGDGKGGPLANQVYTVKRT